MNTGQRDLVLLFVLGVEVIGITALSAFPFWYLNLILVCMFGGVFFAVRNWHDRAFYLVCAGEPLIVACGVINIWAGLCTVWVVAGLVCNALGLLELPLEIRAFGIFCGVAALVAGFLFVSNHVVLPIIVFAFCTGAILAVQAIRDHQWKKQYGVHP